MAPCATTAVSVVLRFVVVVVVVGLFLYAVVLCERALRGKYRIFEDHLEINTILCKY